MKGNTFIRLIIRYLVFAVGTLLAVVCGSTKPDGRLAAGHRPSAGDSPPLTGDSPPSVLVTPAVSPRAARWNVRGAANDWAPVDFGAWVFPHGTNHTSRFPLKVVTNTVTKLNVWIVADRHGVGVRTTNDVYRMLQTVNDIYAQVGMSFYIDKITITNCPAACDVNINGPATADHMSDEQVAAFDSNTGGLECYFIRSFADEDNTVGLNFRSGLLLTQKASATDWAHEIGHACGMDDIYCDRKTNSIPDTVCLKNEHVLWDMSGGAADSVSARYYESNARLTDIIRRLLMYGYGGGTDWHHVDISSGAVEGLDVDGVRGRCATSIFNNGLTTRNPRHE